MVAEFITSLILFFVVQLFTGKDQWADVHISGVYLEEILSRHGEGL
jgi:hypothetical protein